MRDACQSGHIRVWVLADKFWVVEGGEGGDGVEEERPSLVVGGVERGGSYKVNETSARVPRETSVFPSDSALKNSAAYARSTRTSHSSVMWPP